MNENNRKIFIREYVEARGGKDDRRREDGARRDRHILVGAGRRDMGARSWGTKGAAPERGLFGTVWVLCWPMPRIPNPFALCQRSSLCEGAISRVEGNHRCHLAASDNIQTGAWGCLASYGVRDAPCGKGEAPN